MPEFSIVITVYNRERLVPRAVQSCLRQEGAAFEVIVVDDGSNDNSALAVESLGDPRITIVRHDANRGGPAARNSGSAVAKGDWVVMLDSDDELLPGALQSMSRVAREQGDAVERLGFMYRRDDGRVSPLPALRDELLDYVGELRWLEDRLFFDFLQCTRRSTFDHIRWREWKSAGYLLYLSDFAAMYRTFFSSEVLGLVHLDASERASWESRTRRFAAGAAKDLGEEIDVILARHGDALRRYVPSVFRRYQRVRASYYFLTGSIGQGARQCLRCLRESPLSAETWVQLLVGLSGPRPFGWLRSFRPPPT